MWLFKSPNNVGTGSLSLNSFCLVPNLFGSHKSLDRRIKTKYLEGVFLPS